MQEFGFAAPAQTQTFNYLILGIVAVLGVVGIAFSDSKAKRILSAVIIIPVLFFLGTVLIPRPGKTKVILGEQLVITAPPYSTITIARDDIVAASVVNLKEDTPFRPTLRTNGTAMGDYRVGWFMLANGKKAFIMTASPEVVCLELRDKYVLVAPTDFNGFVAALNDRFVPVK